MFVLGIDPGLSRCGYACLAPRRGAPVAVAIGVITTPPDLDVPRRLALLASDVTDLLDEYPVTHVAVERVLFQTNVRTAMSVGQASGVVMAQAAGRGLGVTEYSPNQIKDAVTGDGAADKATVGKMVQTLLALDRVPRPADAADAAAIALCHLAHSPALVAPTAGATP